jgi:hypothetical protein
MKAMGHRWRRPGLDEAGQPRGRHRSTCVLLLPQVVASLHCVACGVWMTRPAGCSSWPGDALAPGTLCSGRTTSIDPTQFPAAAPLAFGVC